ncbi:MAG: OmpA family protein [Gammaproteobacteria bacterium]|nr:OmpA family protein [Gammaproteobacteria bacterium]
MTEHHHLAVGNLLEHYEIKGILGEGGFGITYLAWEASLSRQVAIKEYLPADLASRHPGDTSVHVRSSQDEAKTNYDYGLQRFREEATTLAKFSHPSIVPVLRVFEANNTVYMVMPYEEGESLSDYLKRVKTIPEAELTSYLMPILDGLHEVHAGGILHRDIKPGNIYLRKSTDAKGNPKGPMLIDFGAARMALGEHSRSISNIVSEGYAPAEQYSSRSKQQGAWTDIYALGATLYHCIAGKSPVDAPHRQECVFNEETDPLTPITQLGGQRYSVELLNAIEKMLAIKPKQRPQSIDDVLRLLGEQPTSGPVKTQILKPGESGFGGEKKEDTKENKEADVSVLDELLNLAGADQVISANEMELLYKKAEENGIVRQKAQRYIVSQARKNGWQIESLTGGVKVEAAEAENTNTRKPLMIGLVALVVALLGFMGWYVNSLSDPSALSEERVATQPQEAVALEVASSSIVEPDQTAPLKTEPRIVEKLKPQITKPAPPKEYEVEFDLTPTNATVYLIGQQSFTIGDKLTKGKYRFRIEAEGYDAETVDHHHSDHTRVVTKTLSKTTYSLYVDVTPSGARIQVLNIKPPYKRGMKLEEGSYKLEVSAPGYKTLSRSAELTPTQNHFAVILLRDKVDVIRATLDGTGNYFNLLRKKLTSIGVTVSRTPEGLHISLPGHVRFLSKHALLPSTYETLNSVALVLRKFDKPSILILGHTDSSESDEANQTLSERRASSVMAYFATQGVAKVRMSAVGYGERYPVMSNRTKEGRAANRRIEIEIRNPK